MRESQGACHTQLTVLHSPPATALGKQTLLAFVIPPVVTALAYFLFLVFLYQGMGGFAEQMLGAAAFSCAVYYPVGLLIVLVGGISIAIFKPTRIFRPAIFVAGGLVVGCIIALLFGGRGDFQSLEFIVFCCLSSVAMYPFFARLKRVRNGS